MSTNYNNNASVPAPFTTRQQYESYLRYLRRDGIPSTLESGKFTAEQLKYVIRVLGTCPPGYENKCAGVTEIYNADTPVFTGTSSNTTQSDISKSAAVQATSNYVPTSFKTTSGTIDPARFGFSADLSAERFVNLTSQRVSGGKVKPLRRQLQSVERTPRELQNFNVADEPWSKNLQDLTNLDRTSKVIYDPAKVGSTTTINNTQVNNLSSTAVSGPGNTDNSPTDTTNSTDTITRPAYEEPSVNNDSSEPYTAGDPIYNVLANGNPILQQPTFSPAADNNIRYNNFPLVDITPMELGSSGVYVPAGPTARATLSQPTPEVTMSREDILGVQEDTQLIINGRTITIRGNDPRDVATQVNCAAMGVKASVTGDDLTIYSCNGLPFLIANGCGGGKYKQVADFHINRGFEQSRDQTTSAAETLYYPLSTPKLYGERGVASVQSVAKDKLLATSKYEYEFSTGRITRVPGKDFYRLPAKVPLITKTESSSFTVGGSDYRVGDRLRLIGGTPVNNTKAPLTKICIDSAGAGYSDPDELQIIIEGESGVGAVGVVTRLDDNGGIAEIVMANYGMGYDYNNPPKITVRDLSPAISPIQIDSAWPDNVVVNPRTTISVSSHRGTYDVNGILTGTEVNKRFVRAKAPVEFGITETVETTSITPPVAYLSPTSSTVIGYPNRALITYSDFSTPQFAKNIRPNSYINVKHYPTTLVDVTSPITVSSINTTDQTVTLEIQQQHIARLKASSGTNDTIVKDTSGNVQFSVTFDEDEIDVSDGVITLSTVYNEVLGQTPTISDSDTGVFSYPKQKLFWIPEAKSSSDVTVDKTDDRFILEDTSFASAQSISDNFPIGTPIEFETREFWGEYLLPESGRARLVDTVNPSLTQIPAELSAKIGINPNADTDPQSSAEDAFLDGYKGLAGPLRVAKFLVTGVDASGAITSLRCIDRGMYKVFPSDLTYGIPLEYDTAPPALTAGAAITDSDRQHTLGVADPARNNVEYGPGHPEYNTGRIVGKHPDWAGYEEFYYDGTGYVPYDGSPGAYDPMSYARVDGNMLSKRYKIDQNPYSATFGEHLKIPNGDQLDFIIPGGSGARVFITAQEVPNCSEKGTAKETLGLPDVVTGLNAPKALARALNDALTGAGYSPDDVAFRVNDGEEVSEIVLETTFPGLNIDSPTPGVLPPLGIEAGDYNLGMLCIEGTLEGENLTPAETIAEIDRLYESLPTGLLEEDQISELTGAQFTEQSTPTKVLSLLCVDQIFTPPGGGGGPDDSSDDLLYGGPGTAYATPAGSYGGPVPLNDNNSIFGDARPTSLRELFKYTIVNPFGNSVTLGGTSPKQNAPTNIFESKRFNSTNISNDLSVEEKAWVDDLRGTNRWAYIENGSVREAQSDLVDVNRIQNSIVYNGDTGNGVTALDFWDPFKGVLPGFIQNEIQFISETDPVSYNDSRTTFGRNNIGKVWWDTSTVRYQWYELGSNADRQRNWGKTFPGSSITVCEWVESKALPENWNGNGTPRWTNRYVTERRLDPTTNRYTMYYYYWVQNRTVVDDRIKRDLGRELDTQTLARYIANPVGYGMQMVSFVSEDSLLVSNASQVLDNERNHLQVNFSRNNNPNGIKHSAWKLMREGDNNSRVPDHLTDKLIDSLCGVNSLGQPVPDPRLSQVESYGIQFRPRQTMFRNLKDARRVAVSVLNNILADIKLNTQYPEWDASLSNNLQYIITSNWYAVNRVDSITKDIIRYDASYKPVFNVNSVAELAGLVDLPDGTVVQVSNEQNNASELWLYAAPDRDFKQISVANETVQLSDNVFTDSDNAVLQNELRSLLTALLDNVFANNELWNTFFFEMLKHAYMEQQQLSWAFKTSYLYIEKEEDDLVQFTGFKPDNFQKVLDYMNEVKPYNAKIREYKDGKRTPIDLIGQNNISDYDKPPYVDPDTNSVRILDDYNAVDFAIMANNSMYVDYVSDPDKTNDPFRKIHSSLVFDRTNWQLTEPLWDKTAVPLNMSIARNVANLSLMSKQEVSNSQDVRAIDRIFKFDNQVQATFIAEVNTYFNDVTASSNTEIVGNADVLFDMIENGQLKLTQELVKDKVGGNFRGETLDAKKFSTIIDDVNYINQVIDEFGYDTELWDANFDNDVTEYTDSSALENYGPVTSIGKGDVLWDSTIQLVNYEGVLNTTTQGNVTLRRNDETVEGFDGVTFQRVLYGEERPEEMALFDPLESVVITVHTEPSAIGQATFVSEYDPDDVSIQPQYATVSADNVIVVNSGIGYVNPQVVFYDAANNQPTASAVATAEVDATGAVTSITVTDSGQGYESIRVEVVSDATATTQGTAKIGSYELELADTANILVGQSISVGSDMLGEIVSIQGNTVILTEQIFTPLADETILTLSGKDFIGTVDTGLVTEGMVYIDKQYALQELSGIVEFTEIPGNTSVVAVSDVAFSNIEKVTGTADPDQPAYFFKEGVENSWDSAGDAFFPGSYDFEFNRAGSITQEKVSPDAASVTYRTHLSLFGDTDYLRIRPETSTTIVAPVYTYSEEIVVDNATFMVEPTSQQPGMIWVGSERIHFARRDGNALSVLTRGVAGTTIQDHIEGTEVYSAESGEYFNSLNPKANVWLDTGTKYNNPASWDEAVDNTPTDRNDNDWTVQIAWDEIAQGGLTTSNATGIIDSVTSDETTAVIVLSETANVAIGEGVKITSNSNSELSQIAIVSNVNGIVISVNDNAGLNTELFVEDASVTLTSYNYAGQEPEDRWDAATITGQAAQSLSDRANADLSSAESIMRFLHKL